MVGLLKGGSKEASRLLAWDAFLWRRSFFGLTPSAFISRWIWQLPQSLLGFFASHFVLIFRTVHKAEEWRGTLVLFGPGWRGSICLGEFILLHKHAGPLTKMHEFGHTLQSRESGPLYLFFYGLPSVLNHAKTKSETDANRRAFGTRSPLSKYPVLPYAHKPKWYHWAIALGILAGLYLLMIAG